MKVIFNEAQIKAQILASTEDPFRAAYLVDVEVGTMKGRPLVYKVLTLHEVMTVLRQPR